MRISLRGDSIPILALLVIASCSGDRGTEVHEPEFSGTDTWGLSEEPVYSLTNTIGDPAVVIHGVEDAHIFDDGSAVISTYESRRLIYLDEVGNAVATVGGPGSGPGEFMGTISFLVGSGRGIGVYDQSRRFSHFGHDGAYSFHTTMPSRRVLGYIPGEGAVAVRYFTPAGQQRVYEIWSDDGTLSKSLPGAVEPLPTAISWNTRPTPELVAAGFPDRVMNITTDLPSRCVARSGETVIDAFLFVMNAVDGTVSSLSVQGESQLVYRSPQRRYITEGLYSELRPHMSVNMPDPPNDTIEAAMRRTLPIGAALPAWTDLIGDPSGRLWLRTYGCTDTAKTDTYGVIDIRGTELGTVSIPRSLRVLAVRGDRVLVLRHDDLGVEHVELYLIR